MWLGHLGRVAFTLLLVTATYWTARLGYADHLAGSESVQNVRRAVALAPDSPRYALRSADLMEAAGENPDEALRHALATNPQEAWKVMGRLTAPITLMGRM